MIQASRIILIVQLLFWAGVRNLSAEDVIRIGFNIPQTGTLASVGSHARNAAELVRTEIERAGGLELAGKKYKVIFLYGDNRSDPSVAASLATEQIARERVLGIIGPLSSNQAAPVGQLVNSYGTPMISPWSTSPLTTKDRPFVFSCCVLYSAQGPAIAKFAAGEFKAKKAAVLYDIVNAYPRGMAGAFKESFEKANGPGSVVAFVDFRTGDTDFTRQLQQIKASGAEFLFLPQYSHEVPGIIREAMALGFSIPIVGGGSWAGGDLMAKCGDDCKGRFFVGNYAPGNARGLNRQFVELYSTAYGILPDEPAALTWDATRLLLAAIVKTGGLGGDLLADRESVRKALSGIRDFDGAAGAISFTDGNNPNKCPIIVKIAEDGVFTYHDSVCP